MKKVNGARYGMLSIRLQHSSQGQAPLSPETFILAQFSHAGKLGAEQVGI